MASFSTIRWDLATEYFHKKQEKLLGYFTQGISVIHTVKKSKENFPYLQLDVNISQLVEIFKKKMLMVFCMQRKLEINISRLISKKS